MPPHQNVVCSGTITEVFAHRFVLKTGDGAVLADLGPKGAALFALRTGDAVHITGEQKPSEIKVHTIALAGQAAVSIEHGPKKPPHHEHADPALALHAADAAGFTPLGEARRKPKHFELRARDAKGHDVELHIDLDGRIRKTLPIGLA